MSDKMHKVEIIVTKEPPNIDDFATVEELNKMRVESAKKKLELPGNENDQMKSMLEKLFNCNREKTPSEKIVQCAKERDIIFDHITMKKMEL